MVQFFDASQQDARCSARARVVDSSFSEDVRSHFPCPSGRSPDLTRPKFLTFAAVVLTIPRPAAAHMGKPAPRGLVARVRSPAWILTASLALAFASGYGTQVFAQSVDEVACGLEQRLAPWRPTCHTPFHFAAAVPAVPEVSRTRLARAATLSVFGRSRFPSDRDNGTVWAGKGLSFQLAAGIGGSLGPIRYSVFPVVHWAQNLDFVVADTASPGHSPYAYRWELTRIDWPQRFGSTADGDVRPGQSFLEITGWSRAAMGVSTENIWWGPSKRYPMLLGATSDGFPHVYGRAPTLGLGPLRTVVRAVFGRLTESQYFDQAEENNRNLFGALRVEIGLTSHPGVQLAMTSMVRQRWSPELSFVDVFRLVPRSTAREADGIGALTVLLPVTSLGLQLHATWGRGDFFLNTEDLLTQPDHNQFWSVGLHRDWSHADDGPTWSLSTEHASSAASVSQYTSTRGPYGASVYRHDESTQGHTQRGQLLGPSIGPGARAAYASLRRTVNNHYMGVLVERILWDIDAFRRSVPNVSPDGQDREWLFGGRIGMDLNISGVEHLRLDAFGGASIRWNRQYVRFTGDLLDYPERETNFWLDLRLAWTPDRGDARR